MQNIEMLEELAKKELVTKEESDSYLKAAYTQAFDNVGLVNLEAGELIVKYIDFEIARN